MNNSSFSVDITTRFFISLINALSNFETVNTTEFAGVKK
ncbi:hypothetical protein CLV42_10798 [Chitinophaga ginsengisoli]|uniref:Uncharacterized protein n=2 Tax=Chitinophaga TaxID=79328 RepID=A0A1G7XS34_CHIFI|nr:hypothetical protein CLV42_10798 [Chitinophaga ginsengisoli]SDG87045.1 hypothetical protein SAMN04488121_10758 [Chitinophaga filiformis]